MTPTKLLITGSSGRIGRILWQGLADAFDIYGLDLCVAEPSERVQRADIANAEQVSAAVAQLAPLGAIVHLAGDPRVEADWQSALMNNIVGTRNIYEAARQTGVRRVVFASSNHATGAYEGFPPQLHRATERPLISRADPLRPDSFYGVSKASGEALARMYYELHGIASVCLRIGSVLADDDPTQDERHRSTWLSHRDLIQLVRRSLLADVPFGIYYGISANSARFWDIADAQTELDYRPEDDAARR